MEAALVGIAVFQGFVMGLVSFDMMQRLNDRKALLAAEESNRKAQEALADLHNNATQTIKNLSDKVSAMEAARQMGPQATTMKRF